MSWRMTPRGRRGIWCPRHPAEQLVRIKCPGGKTDLRCEGCTKELRKQIRIESMEPEKGVKA